MTTEKTVDANRCRSQSVSSGRTTLVQRNQKIHAKCVTFFKNGDRFFKGVSLPISQEKFRSFDTLLKELSAKMALDSGAVRFIFAEDGCRITHISQLQQGMVYICSSNNNYKPVHSGYGREPSGAVVATTPSSSTPRLSSSTHSVNSADSGKMEHGSKEFIRPRLVTVVKNERLPQRKITVLLNVKTAPTLEKVLDSLSERNALGKVCRLCTLDGRVVRELRELFENDYTFIALGNTEKFPEEGIELDSSLMNMNNFRDVKRASSLKRMSSSSKLCRKVLDDGSVALQVSGKSKPRNNQPTSNTSPIFQPVHRHSVKLSGSATLDDLSRFPASLFGLEAVDLSLPGDKSEVKIPYVSPSKIERMFLFGDVLGDGNFAVVKHCTQRHTGDEYAAKIMEKKTIKGKESYVQNEVKILRIVHHPNIVRLLDQYQTQRQIYLFMELVKGGDLFNAIAEQVTFPEDVAAVMVGDLASAVCYLHFLNIVHRDIKPENLLVFVRADGWRSLKLTDFGLSEYVTGSLNLVCGTPTYVAPEILSSRGYGLKIDTWAIGVITYILLCGYPPFVSPTGDQDDLFDLVLAGTYEFQSPYWDEITQESQDLIRSLLVVDPEIRYRAEDILMHPWIKLDRCLSYQQKQARLSSSGNSSCSWMMRDAPILPDTPRFRSRIPVASRTPTPATS